MANGQVETNWVIAKISSKATDDGFDIRVDASALSMGRRGKEIASGATSFRAIK